MASHTISAPSEASLSLLLATMYLAFNYMYMYTVYPSFPSLPTPLSPFSFPQVQGNYNGRAVKGNRDANISPSPLGVLPQGPSLAASYTTVGVVSYSTSSVECWPHIGMGHLKDNPELHNALVLVQYMSHVYILLIHGECIHVYTFLIHSSCATVL